MFKRSLSKISTVFLVVKTTSGNLRLKQRKYGTREIESGLLYIAYFCWEEPLTLDTFLYVSIIKFIANQMNKPGPFVEFKTGPAYSFGFVCTKM